MSPRRDFLKFREDTPSLLICWASIEFHVCSRQHTPWSLLSAPHVVIVVIYFTTYCRGLVPQQIWCLPFLPPRLQAMCQLECLPVFKIRRYALAGTAGRLTTSKRVDCSHLRSIFCAVDTHSSSISVCVAHHAGRYSFCTARAPPPVLAPDAGSI